MDDVERMLMDFDLALLDELFELRQQSLVSQDRIEELAFELVQLERENARLWERRAHDER